MDLDILQITREVGLAGGSECVAFELHRAWLALGIEAYVLTGNATEPDGREGVFLSVSWLKNLEFGWRTRHLATLLCVPLFTLAATWRVFRSRRPKIIVSHGDSLVGDVCVVHSVNRACLEQKRRTGYYGWLLNPSNLWVAWRDWWMWRGGRYRRLVAISERVRKELKEYYHVPEDRIVTIPNGINLSRFTPENRAFRQEIRDEFHIPEDVQIVLFVGSRFRIKGLKFAIEALSKMQTNAILLVVGNDAVGPYKHLAEELGIASRVIFAGARNDLPRIYPAADVFLLPTLYETFALVCLEAMASGLPVVAAPAGGIEDYLVDGVNGFQIPHNPEEIASKLDQLLSDQDLQERFRAAGLITASEYSWDKIAKQYLNLFDELIRERTASLHQLMPAVPKVSG